MSPEATPSADAVKGEIASEIARVHLESYGEAATNLKVAIAEEFVSVLMDVELSRAEQTLIDAGKADAVKLSRETFQEAIESTFVAIVERATGKRVSGFASRTVIGHLPPWSIEIFRFGPPASGGAGR